MKNSVALTSLAGGLAMLREASVARGELAGAARGNGCAWSSFNDVPCAASCACTWGVNGAAPADSRRARGGRLGVLGGTGKRLGG